MSFNPPATHRNTLSYDEHDAYNEFTKGSSNGISNLATPRSSFYHTPSLPRRPVSRQSMGSELLHNNFQSFSRLSMMSPFPEPRESIMPVEDIKSSNRWLIEVPIEKIKANVTQFVSSFESYTRNDSQNIFENIKGYQDKLASNINFVQVAQKSLSELREQTKAYQEDLELDKEIENKENEGVVSLERTLAKTLEKETELKREVDNLKERLRKKNEEKLERLNQIRAQVDSARSEIEFLEPALNMEIRKRSAGTLSFFFKDISSSSPSRQCSFELDISTREYKVVNSEPPILNSTELVDQLNETRNFYHFLKAIRNSLKTAINS